MTVTNDVAIAVAVIVADVVLVLVTPLAVFVETETVVEVLFQSANAIKWVHQDPYAGQGTTILLRNEEQSDLTTSLQSTPWGSRAGPADTCTILSISQSRVTYPTYSSRTLIRPPSPRWRRWTRSFTFGRPWARTLSLPLIRRERISINIKERKHRKCRDEAHREDLHASAWPKKE